MVVSRMAAGLPNSCDLRNDHATTRFSQVGRESWPGTGRYVAHHISLGCSGRCDSVPDDFENST